MSNEMKKHSPGPWIAVHNDSFWQIDSEAHREVGNACASDFIYLGDVEDGCTSEFAEGNALLMAAAPELLEALESLLHAYCDPGNEGSDHDEKVKAARAAIAKAQGTSP